MERIRLTYHRSSRATSRDPAERSRGLSSRSARKGVSTSLDTNGLRASGKREAGFTLVELMVVIVIIGLLATVVVINVMPASDRAAVTKARADIATLEQGVEMYRLNNLRYPSGEEGLDALVSGGFIRRLPDDPWGNPYVYTVPGADGQPYQIASYGPDGERGGSDGDEDITN